MDHDRITSLVNPSMWGGAILGGVGGMTATDWLAIGGFVLAFAGFCVNWWHKRQMVQIAKARLELDRRG